MPRKRLKFFMLIFLTIFVFFISADYNYINIEKTALIVSIGIDKKDGLYSVTTQIAIPQASADTAQNSESIITGEGETIYSAISKIGEQTGWYPKLSFCNLIVLGESVLDGDVMEAVDFFVRSYKVEDSAILCACEGSAKDLLASTSPLDNVSGFALSKIFVRDFNTASRVMTTTIKNFSIGYFSKSKSNFMPLVKIKKIDDKVSQADNGLSGTSGESGSGSSSGSLGGNSSSKENGSVIYDATSTLLFYQGKKVGELDGELSLFFSLLFKSVNEASFSIKSHDQDGKEGTFLISVTKATHRRKLTFVDNKPVFTVYLDLWLKVSDSNLSQSINEVSSLGKLNNETLYKAQTYTQNKINEIFNTAKDSGSDVFEYVNLLYKHYPYKYNEHKLTIKDNISHQIYVKCKNAN